MLGKHGCGEAVWAFAKMRVQAAPLRLSPAVRISAKSAIGVDAVSKTPADRRYHLVDLCFFTVNGRTGGKRRPFQAAAVARAGRKRGAQ